MEGTVEPGWASQRTQYSERRTGTCSRRRVLIKPITMTGVEKRFSMSTLPAPKKAQGDLEMVWTDSMSLQLILRIDCACIC